MQNSNFKTQNFRFLLCIFHFALGVFAVCAQSTSVDFPTPLKSAEISGKIPARDVGDARLTSFYYSFNGTQGDVFINVETANFNGDIDVFNAEGLHPLAKITLFADVSRAETGRILYLRKPEKLIMRVEGRTPDDNPATFKIKFAGSFLPSLADAESAEAPELPEVKTENGGTVRVNSVGTIIEDKKTVAADEKPPTPSEETAVETVPKKIEKRPKTAARNKSKIVVADNIESPETDKTVSEKNNNSSADAAENKAETKSKTTSGETTPGRNRRAARNSRTGKTAAGKTASAEKSDSAAEVAADPLENVNLIVLLKNGDRLEYPMKDVFRFSLNNGVLTIVTKNGKIERRPIVEVQRMTVE